MILRFCRITSDSLYYTADLHQTIIYLIFYDTYE